MIKIKILLTILLLVPAISFASSNLAEKLEGKILLAAEDRGKTYYVKNGYKYRIDRETALPVFQTLALGINNENLKKIPEKNLGYSYQPTPEKIKSAPPPSENTIIEKKVLVRLVDNNNFKGGRYYPDSGLLIVNTAYGAEEAGRTLVHELAHAYWWGKPAEAEAEKLPEILNQKTNREKLAYWFEQYIFEQNILAVFNPEVYNFFANQLN